MPLCPSASTQAGASAPVTACRRLSCASPSQPSHSGVCRSPACRATLSQRSARMACSSSASRTTFAWQLGKHVPTGRQQQGYKMQAIRDRQWPSTICDYFQTCFKGAQSSGAVLLCSAWLSRAFTYASQVNVARQRHAVQMNVGTLYVSMWCGPGMQGPCLTVGAKLNVAMHLAVVFE